MHFLVFNEMILSNTYPCFVATFSLVFSIINFMNSLYDLNLTVTMCVGFLYTPFMLFLKIKNVTICQIYHI